MVGLENQNEYNCIDFLVIVAYFRAKAENGCLTGIIIECRYNIFCRIDLFPLFIPSIPTFHYSIIPCGFPMWMTTKNTIFPTSCRNSETLINIQAKGKADHVTSD